MHREQTPISNKYMVYLYSSTILSFRRKIKHLAFDILVREVKVSVLRKYVLVRNKHYPLDFVVFEDPSQLGFFDSKYYTLGINKRLMYEANDNLLKNIIRHELAHFMVFILYGTTEPHGLEFHSFCRSKGWRTEVTRAYTNIETENKLYNRPDHEKLLEKIKKVLALTESSNPHEAELATIKANELLLRYNLKSVGNMEDDDETCIKRVLKASRNNAKISAIAGILRTFFVRPVFNHGRGILYLEVVGTRANVELSDYVASFLDINLDFLWIQYQKDHPSLKGLRMKNSFFRGIETGYVQKIKKAQQEISKNSLTVIEDDLERRVKISYGQLGTSRTSARVDPHAASLGEMAGKNLSIRKGVEQNNGGVQKLIT